MNRPDKKNAITRAMYGAMTRRWFPATPIRTSGRTCSSACRAPSPPARSTADFLAPLPWCGEGGREVWDFCMRWPRAPSRSSLASTALRSASARRSTSMAISPSPRRAPCSARPSSISAWCRKPARACSCAHPRPPARLRAALPRRRPAGRTGADGRPDLQQGLPRTRWRRRRWLPRKRSPPSRPRR